MLQAICLSGSFSTDRLFKRAWRFASTVSILPHMRRNSSRRSAKSFHHVDAICAGTATDSRGFALSALPHRCCHHRVACYSGSRVSAPGQIQEPRPGRGAGEFPAAVSQTVGLAPPRRFTAVNGTLHRPVNRSGTAARRRGGNTSWRITSACRSECLSLQLSCH